MPIGFKRYNKHKHRALLTILHSERKNEKEYILECMKSDVDNIPIQKNKTRPSIKEWGRLNQDTNTKKKFGNERNYNRDSKYSELFA
jgi:hypothetical protein